MPPRKEPEKKTFWDYIVKYQMGITFAVACFLSYNKDWANNRDQINEVKIAIAELRITVNNIINELHRD